MGKGTFPQSKNQPEEFKVDGEKVKRLIEGNPRLQKYSVCRLAPQFIAQGKLDRAMNTLMHDQDKIRNADPELHKYIWDWYEGPGKKFSLWDGYREMPESSK